MLMCMRSSANGVSESYVAFVCVNVAVLCHPCVCRGCSANANAEAEVTVACGCGCPYHHHNWYARR